MIVSKRKKQCGCLRHRGDMAGDLVVGMLYNLLLPLLLLTGELMSVYLFYSYACDVSRCLSYLL